MPNFCEQMFVIASNVGGPFEDHNGTSERCNGQTQRTRQRLQGRSPADMTVVESGCENGI